MERNNERKKYIYIMLHVKILRFLGEKRFLIYLFVTNISSNVMKHVNFRLDKIAIINFRSSLGHRDNFFYRSNFCLYFG
jgi:hypothetical protein